MPCNCPGDIASIGINPPYANQADVVRAIQALDTCCTGSIANATDPVTNPSGATNEGFPGGLSSSCSCDVLWLTKPNGSLYVSGDGGTSWNVVYEAPLFMEALATTGLPICNDGTLTTITGLSVTNGDTSLYNGTAGELTVSLAGIWQIEYRIEFAAAALVSAGVVRSELEKNGVLIRHSQKLSAAHGNASYPVSVGNAISLELAANDVITHEVLIAGSGNETPASASLHARLVARS